MTLFNLHLLLGIGALLVPSQHRIGHAASPHRTYATGQASIGYKISRIDSISNLYIIYATRNDSVFKIVSLNQKGINCTTLRVNGTYSLTLHSRFEGKYAIKSQDSDFNVSYNYYGTPVSLEKERGVRDLFTADNLKGLCLSK